MKRKKYWFLFAILLLSLSSLSPSFDFTHHTRREPPGDEPNPPQQRPEVPETDLGPIKVGVQVKPDELRQLKALNERFMEETGAEVEILPLETSETSKESFLLEMSLGEGPDIVLTDSHYIKALAMSGCLLPVDASQGTLPGEDILNGLLPPLQWNGYQWGMPFDIDPYIMIWQTKGKDGEPFKMPQSRQAWQEYSEVHKASPVLLFDSNDPYAFGAAVHLLEGDPSKPDQEVLHMLIRNQGRWAESAQGAMEAEVDDQELTTTDKTEAAVVIKPYSSLSDQDDNGMSHALAMGEARLDTPVVRTRSFAVAAHTESSALAMKWITYMTGKEMQREWSRAAGTLPVISELYVTGTNLSDRGIWQKAAVPAQVLLSRNEPAALDFGESEGFQTYSEAANRLLLGEITIEEYMKMYTPAQP
ncbi:extracellular solute-binding protein [Paenibacillus sp. p3-SID867]|uniref:extracellular solute-binding protein n=1 Tax=Paenibacillus sp. p3-SID867 TaxID=2916363 RepID=UPI0021A853B2|nr:extracellular solute-binding protein [Paenibacillus sp. p3-SID867]MCT1397776.1 extracellular solute-binding protein [Paenibacillus sp. p3-SID867]